MMAPVSRTGAFMMMVRVIPAFCSLCLVAATPAFADHPIEEVEVLGQSTSEVLEMDVSQPSAADSGELLQKLPGANANSNGPLTAIAQFRGMYGDRVGVSIDGMSMTGGGPNAMDAPLSYAPAVLLDSIRVYRGIAPVSVAQQSIGGVMQLVTRRGGFSDSDKWQVHDTVLAGGGDNASSTTAYALVNTGNRRHNLYVAGLDERGDDYEYPGGAVTPSEYERQRYEMGYAWQDKGQNASLDLIRQETGDTGTPALPMDIRYIDSTIARLAYGLQRGSGRLDVHLQSSDIEHAMTNYHLREAPPAMQQRSTLATAKGNDIKAVFEAKENNALWRIGFDLHDAVHDAEISNPNDSAFLISNFNDVENRIAGAFIETEQQVAEKHRLDLGMRINRVMMDAGDVYFSGLMGMMASNATILRDAFNDSKRDVTDHNLDLVAKWHYRIAREWKLSTELGRKTRSASYQERYLWLPMQSTGGLADGFTYIGDPNLDPEVANEINLGLTWNDGRSYIAPRFFYRKVTGYIQGTPLQADPSDPAVTAALALANMMSGQAPLVFSNVDAIFYGLDIDWHSRLAQILMLRGAISVVRGERDDINDNLYRVSPDHVSVALDYKWRELTNTVEVIAYDDQGRVSQTNNEQTTPGYALVNMGLRYDAPYNMIVSAGINNVFDRGYAAHLAGINRAQGSDVAVGERLPGMGRNIYARMSWSF